MLKRVRKAFKAAPPTDEGEEEGAEEGSKSPGRKAKITHQGQVE